MVAGSPPSVLGLLRDPLRWQLVVALGRSDRRVGELVTIVGKPQSLVSYHLATLRRAGLVRSHRSSADGRDVYYRADLQSCQDLLGATGLAMHPGARLVPAPPEDARAWPSSPRVLFLCTGNSARSQIAEGLAKHRSGGAVAAVSAGSAPKALHPNAVRVMAERGIDISRCDTKALTRFTDQRFDRVVTLCDKVREVCPEFPGAPITTHWSTPDPAAQRGDPATTYAAFQRTADEIDERVRLLLAELRTT